MSGVETESVPRMIGVEYRHTVDGRVVYVSCRHFTVTEAFVERLRDAIGNRRMITARDVVETCREE